MWPSPPVILGHPEQCSQAQPPILSLFHGNRHQQPSKSQLSNTGLFPNLLSRDAQAPRATLHRLRGGELRLDHSILAPVQCSSHPAPRPGGPAAILPSTLGLNLLVHPYNKEKVPEVGIHLLSTSRPASSVHRSPEQWAQGWWNCGRLRKGSLFSD